jgi:hypothetical protein
MKIYHGERTTRGCEVTVDGTTLLRRADLSGNDSSPFDWGFIGTGQLALAILSDFLGDDPKARAMCAQFEKEVIAELPHRSWSLSGKDLDKALIGMNSSADTVVSAETHAGTAAFGDMPAKSIVASERAIGAAMQSREILAPALTTGEVKAAAGNLIDAAHNVATAALAVGKAAHQVAHVADQPGDEAMSITTRAADQKADATNQVVDKAAALALAAADDANRVLADLERPAR